MNETNKNQDLIEGLRKMAKFLEDKPTFPRVGWSNLYCFFNDDSEGSAERFADAARLLGSSMKSADGEWMNFTKEFSRDLRLQLTRKRALCCKKVVVGTKIIPAEEEKTIVFPAKAEQVVEVTAWECPDSFLAGKQAEKEQAETSAQAEAERQTAAYAAPEVLQEMLNQK